MTTQPNSQRAHLIPADVVDPSAQMTSLWSSHITMLWLSGMFFLLPIEMLKLPFNVTLVDLWIILGMPVIWLLVPRGQHVISLTYALPMWLILFGSLASILIAPSPINGLIVVLKELFVFGWFIAVTFSVVGLSDTEFRRILVVWRTVIILHGLIIIAQFLSPEIWRSTAGYLGRGAHYQTYRPSGLFTNANGAALFQLLGFVPLLLSKPSPKIGTILGILLLGTILPTGSMAAILALVAGSITVIGTLLMQGHLFVIGRNLVKLVVSALLVAALLFPIISQNQRYEDHLQEILLGRAERSSESRFDLWERGMRIFLDRGEFFWGIGPENFRVVDGRDNQLHNDFLAFLVERGVISALGLGLFVLLAMNRAIQLFAMSGRRHSSGTGLVVIVFLAAMVSALVYSLTHQLFHNRQLWVVLAFQEAMYVRLMTSNVGRGLPATGVKASFPRYSGFHIGSQIGGT